MIKPWRQCVHGAARISGGARLYFVPVGPLREGGRIVEIRLSMNGSVSADLFYGLFVCGTPDQTAENALAGTPIIGWTNYKHLGLGMTAFRSTPGNVVSLVLPCSIRVVGGGKWVLCTVFHPTGLTNVLCSVTAEGVDRPLVERNGLGVEDGLAR